MKAFERERRKKAHSNESVVRSSIRKKLGVDEC
jgi:hypothetical protein